ncbi:SLAM family member 5-like isoform X1 [Pimephales promelas]|uniref:SLAM family member 5-like isoform X1 n=1 Tax=Pimephales promelas TaxID=90988 RepID=UPI001955849F|nr:SLAM family member 5-like isoform X1 [Pimephales promelas]
MNDELLHNIFILKHFTLVYSMMICALFMCFLLFKGVFGAENTVKTLSVMEGDSVTLLAGLIETQRIDLILWTFGPESTRIAQINRPNNKISYYDVLDGRFRDRLKLDHQTGSLTITNTTTEHDGLYELQIFGEKEVLPKQFSIMVYYARLPVPVISRNCSSSSSSCSLVCSSMVNVSHVTLSWYAGMSVLSSISASDLSISLSLPLEVEYQDKNTYSCVLNNPISNQTTHLDINTLCRHTCAVDGSTIRTGGSSFSHIVLLICVFVGVPGIILAVVGIFVIYRKYRKTDHVADEGVAEKVELRTVSVTIGEPVTLNTGLTEIQSYDVLQWRFGKLGTDETNPFEVVTRLNELNNSGCHDHNGRFHLDRKTGYLTINDIKPTDIGVYKLNVTRNGRNIISKMFMVQDSSGREEEKNLLSTESGHP